MTDPTVPPARPILGVDRRSGAFLELVPSASTPGLYHLVDPIGRTCDCRGWAFRRTCRHLSPTAPSRPLADGGAAHLAVQRAAGSWPTASIMGVEKTFVPADVAAMADLAREIWGSDQ